MKSQSLHALNPHNPQTLSAAILGNASNETQEPSQEPSQEQSGEIGMRRNTSGDLPSVSSVASSLSDHLEQGSGTVKPAIYPKLNNIPTAMAGALDLKKIAEAAVDIPAQTWANEAHQQIPIKPREVVEQAPEIQTMQRPPQQPDGVEGVARQVRNESTNLCCNYTEQYIQITSDCFEELDSTNSDCDKCMTWLGATIICPIGISLTIVGAILGGLVEGTTIAAKKIKKECCE